MLQILSHKPGSFVWKSEINEDVHDYITGEIMDICITLSSVEYDVTVWDVKEKGNDIQVAHYWPRKGNNTQVAHYRPRFSVSGRNREGQYRRILWQ